MEATPRFELGVGALQAHALPLGHVATEKVRQLGRPLNIMERTTGFEPATPTLARWCSTN